MCDGGTAVPGVCTAGPDSTRTDACGLPCDGSVEMVEPPMPAARQHTLTKGATLAFLESHEPDLIDVANAIGCKPEALIAARAELER